MANWFGSTAVQWWLMLPGIPLAALTAVYTAYLFAQAKARDLWQNPLLPPHLLIQSVLLGCATILLLSAGLDGGAPDLVLTVNGKAGELTLLWGLAVSSLIHLLMIWGETSLTHSTAHARVAVWEMMHGRYAQRFLVGHRLVGAGRAHPCPGDSRFCRYVNWRCRCHPCATWNDALRARVRAGGTVSAAGVIWSAPA